MDKKKILLPENSALASANKIESELAKEISELKEVSVLKTQHVDKFQIFDACQSQISEILFQDEDGNLITEDFEGTEEYRDIDIDTCSHIQKRCNCLHLLVKMENESQITE